MSRATLRLSLCALFVVVHVTSAYSYSVLSHEAIIDSAWKNTIENLLRKKFARATPEQLQQARAYAYGGCVIQDMGYYPFGSHLFSDLTHYVRSGDFIVAMLRDAQDVNEYAFALGAMAHYAADNTGHPLAVNLAVPILYPKLRGKYGDAVSYAQNPKAHIATEFGFDVVQIAHGLYAPESYHDFIGFEVSKPLLERAFLEIYGLELKDVFGSVDLAIGTYRRSVSTFIPKLTQAAWTARRDDIIKSTPGLTRDRFVYNITRADYEKTWGRDYRKPGFGVRTLALLLRIVPKIGPFKAGAFRTPTRETEQLFAKSFAATLERYTALLRTESAGRLNLPNENFDLGQPSKPGTYKLADKAYAVLVDRLAKHDFEGVSHELRNNILAFYDIAHAPIEPKSESKKRRQLYAQLQQLRSGSVGIER